MKLCHHWNIKKGKIVSMDYIASLVESLHIPNKDTFVLKMAWMDRIMLQQILHKLSFVHLIFRSGSAIESIHKSSPKQSEHPFSVAANVRSLKASYMYFTTVVPICKLGWPAASQGRSTVCSRGVFLPPLHWKLMISSASTRINDIPVCFIITSGCTDQIGLLYFFGHVAYFTSQGSWKARRAALNYKSPLMFTGTPFPRECPVKCASAVLETDYDTRQGVCYNARKLQVHRKSHATF